MKILACPICVPRVQFWANLSGEFETFREPQKWPLEVISKDIWLFGGLKCKPIGQKIGTNSYF